MMHDFPGRQISDPSRWAPAAGLARYLSIAGHPFVAIPASIGAISALRGGDLRAALATGVGFVAVSAGIGIGMAAGHFDDFDVSDRERRPRFYALVTSVTVALGFWLRAEPSAFRACMAAAALLAACGLLNRWTKVSLHTAFGLYAAGLWGAWSIVAGLLALPLAAAVAWSRVRLGRHSAGEVGAGVLVGSLAAACLLAL